jgi:hypothetical protein
VNRSGAGRAVAVTIPLALAAAAAWAVLWPRPAATIAHRLVPPAVTRPAACAPVPSRFTGVALPAPQASTLPAFIRVSGVRPQVLEYYAKFGYGLITGPAMAAEKAGAVPLLQWIPPHHDLLAQIAAGKFDGYLRRFAAQMKAFGCPLMLSFGHEFNGPWWPWGRGRQPASAFAAAWQHMHAVLAAAGVRNVVWVWNPNVVSGPAVASPAPWWPGSGCVDMVALDGYYWGPSDSFASVFARSVSGIRGITRKPVFVAETGAYPGPGMAGRITGLFRGAAQTGLAGVVYFDISGDHDWRLENDPAALSAFRAAAEKHGTEGAR